jgi:D-3-phosphoglycerate dehydrogenase / 2-oxoglutarate reductase
MPTVLISDKLSQDAVKVFEDRGVKVDFKPGMSAEDLLANIGKYEGLAIRSATKVTPAVLAKAAKLKVIGRAGIGVDNVDTAAATQKGVVVMNTPFGNTTTTAEHAIAMMMALVRQIPLANVSTQAGKWEKSRFMGMEVTGKTLGLIGCGNVGSIVADRAQGLRMRVVAYDPYLSPERAVELGVEKVDLDELYARADIVTLHTPLTDSTRNLINAESLAKMKKGVRIVHCARGGIVNEADLRAALDSGQVAGAAVDVFEVEPAKENVLFGHENLIATPHLGAATQEAQEIVAVQVAEQMADYLLSGAVTNAVNMPSISAEDAPRLRPYVTLAGQLGSFLGQLAETSMKSVNIEFQGHVAELNVRPLVSAILCGLLRPQLDAVNMVSAPLVARERGIDVSETIHDNPGDYETLIRVTVDSERRTRSVVGTLFGGNRPRLVGINDIPVEAELAEHMLYTTNRDKPGVIGQLGQALGDAGVNVATFHLGRTAPGEDAIALIQVDQPVGRDLIARITALPNVTQAKALRF